LAGIKLSGSLNKFGFTITNMIKINNIIINPNKSLNEKKGWKGILSILLLIPKGLFEPV
jgi:hypothetical protein